jgi:large subunit ribosomal protein L2
VRDRVRPDCSARIALLHYADGAKSWHPRACAPARRHVRRVWAEADIKPGNALLLDNIPTGTSCTTSSFSRGRAADGPQRRFGRQLGSLTSYAVLRLPSGAAKGAANLPGHRWQVGNPTTNETGGKGPRRWKASPTVRGSAMNLVDHRTAAARANEGRPASARCGRSDARQRTRE